MGKIKVAFYCRVGIADDNDFVAPENVHRQYAKSGGYAEGVSGRDNSKIGWTLNKTKASKKVSRQSFWLCETNNRKLPCTVCSRLSAKSQTDGNVDLIFGD